MKKKLIAVVTLVVMACQPAKVGVLNEHLDKSSILGCYASSTLPNIEILEDRIVSNDETIHTSYLFGRGGRANTKMIVIMPRKLPTLSQSGQSEQYTFLPYEPDLGSSSIWNVGDAVSQPQLGLISVPDHVRHTYTKISCDKF